MWQTINCIRHGESLATKKRLGTTGNKKDKIRSTWIRNNLNTTFAKSKLFLSRRLIKRSETSNTASFTGSNAMVFPVRTNRRAPCLPCASGSRCLGLIPIQRPECIELLFNFNQIRASCFQPPATFRQARTFLDKLIQTSGNFSLLSYVCE